MIKEGERIRIRDWKLADLKVYEHWNLGHHKWMDYNGPYYPQLTPKEVEQTIAMLEQRIKENAWQSPRPRIAIADREKDQLLGTVSWYWQSQETNWMSIGIAIFDDAYWGKGIGYEALKLWVDYLFEVDQSLVRLDLRTWSGNPGMIRLGEKVGFKQEACFRKARIVKGKYYDSIGMGILREEWEQSDSISKRKD